jgi:hypothetical protein
MINFICILKEKQTGIFAVIKILQINISFNKIQFNTIIDIGV